MSKEDVVQMQGEIIDHLPDATFRVKLETVMLFSDTYPEICGCTTSGSSGCKVTVQMTPYDLTRGRIVFRVK